MITGIVLLLLGLVLVGPGPLLVRRWTFLQDVPGAGVVLWQAGAVAALLSVTGAGIVWTLDLLGRHDQPAWRIVLSVLGLLFTVQVLGRLVWSVGRVVANTAARRRRHTELVDILSRTKALGTGARSRLAVLEQDLPVAYCLPGLRGSRVVVSEGTVNSLEPVEFAAVLAHEEAHLRARHDVVLDTFTALHRAFPVLVRSRLPLDHCRILVEMLADDAAVQRIGRVPLARALTKIGGAPVPEAALGVGNEAVLRVRRLAAPPARPQLTAMAVSLLALGLTALPVAILAAGFLLEASIS
ncbi:M56 family metallopeptidase [Propionibacteriaceae bacterium Y1685]|uniref:M56 family metallopeptidase n=1 Tax=Microlunatus sp. Y1700 TaxID=3418487 RepID=UPI003B7E8D24